MNTQTSMNLLSNMNTDANLQYTLFLWPDCKYFHPFDNEKYNKTGSTCYIHHMITACTFKLHLHQTTQEKHLD